MARMQTRFFSALSPETEEQIKLAKDKIRTFAFNRGREKFDNSFYFKLFSTV